MDESAKDSTLPWPAGPDRAGPLAGLRVLDLSRILAGPFATMQLADLGADVLKVEAPGRGDETRHWGPPFAADGVASYYLAVNRNKRSITLDLDDPDARRIAQRLAAAADVVVDNFLPGRLERFGLDDATLRAADPRIITATVTGFASTGVHAGRPGFDLLAQAMGGMMAITGDPERPPQRVGVAISDLVSGLFLNHGILAALVERTRTGRGHHVEVALLDAQVASLANMATAWLSAGVPATRYGNHHPSIAPYGALDASNGTLVVAVGNDRQFTRFADAIGLPELATNPRFVTNRGRVEHRPELLAIIEARLATDTRAEWLARLTRAEVPAAPVNEVSEVFAEPDVRDRLVVEIDGVAQVRSPILIDATPLPVTSAPPPLGAHTDSVLEGLGIDAQERETMRARGAV